MKKSICGRLGAVSLRELRMFAHRPLFLFTMIVAPVLCIIFFSSIMGEGLPTKLPIGLVDKDDTKTTRTIIRIIDSMEETNIVARYPSYSAARRAMQRGEIYGFLYIPHKLTEKAIANRQPRLSFYTNEAYLMPGTLIMKDLRRACELAGIALTRETLYGKGLTEKQAMGILQPIVVETHPLNNPHVDYSVCLNNTIVPGILILLVMLSTTYTIGLEWKLGTQRELYYISGYSSTIALTGKLLPQTLVFSLMFFFFDVYFYKFLMFPCNSGILPMMLLGIVSVLSAQAFGIFIFGLFLGQMRMAMSLCALWGVLSVSISGFAFPVPAMSGTLQLFSWFFPLRHYYLIYVNQALNGYSILYVWPSVVSLLTFMFLPCTILWRYRAAFLKYKYKQ